MICRTRATAFGRQPECAGRAPRTGQRRLPSIAGLGLTVVALLAGGCGGGNMKDLGSTEQFQEQVLKTKKPAMVFFFKGGCATCMLLEPGMEQLAGEYGDRAVFAKYHLMSFFWIPTNNELRKQYDIVVYPTVVMFVDGKEKQRWLMHYDMKSYRKAMDEALASIKAPAAVVPAAAAKGKR